MELEQIEQSLSAALQWFLHSGIQDREQGSKGEGGFYAYYKSDVGNYSYMYSEITGYALTLLAHLHGARPELRETVQASALSAARWLRGFARSDAHPAYRCRYERKPDAFRPDRVCTFDNAMCLNGFAAWARLLDDAEFLSEAKALAGFLTSMQNADGSFNVRYVGSEQKLENTYRTWSTQIGSFLSKGVIGLLHLHRHAPAEAIEASARKAADLALRFQAPAGRFLTHILEQHTLQHPHMYTVEGLLAAATHWEDERYLRAAFRGIDWSLSTQLEDGGFPSIVHGDGSLNLNQRMDIQAQILRAALWARALGYAPDMERVRLGMERLLAMQSTSQDPALQGGFLYGWEHDGTHLPHANSWVTMFAIQALLAYSWALRDSEAADLFLLV